MKQHELENWLESGQAELYAMGALSPQEAEETEALALSFPEVRAAIQAAEEALEALAFSEAEPPPPTSKPMIFSTIDFQERLALHPVMQAVPELNEQSTASDYDHWLSNPDFTLPDDFREIHAIMIGQTPELTSLIVWLEHGAPLETHWHQIEKFLILEGHCELVIEGQPVPLKTGDYLAIPTGKEHFLRVTSSVPCKVILQRRAA